MKYTTLFFDLDNTLLDFYASEKVAVKTVMGRNGIEPTDQNAKLYSAINQKYWEKYEKGEIQKNDIFVNRFKELAETLNVSVDCQKISDEYFSELANGHDICENAEEILQYLKNKDYKIFITTNGIAKTQYKRISESGLSKYFDGIFVSEECGFQKPDKRYFEYCFEKANLKNKSEVLVIGDSPSADILGGINFGIDTCWLNKFGKKSFVHSNYQIFSLLELKNIL